MALLQIQRWSRHNAPPDPPANPPDNGRYADIGIKNAGIRIMPHLQLGKSLYELAGDEQRDGTQAA